MIARFVCWLLGHKWRDLPRTMPPVAICLRCEEVRHEWEWV